MSRFRELFSEPTESSVVEEIEEVEQIEEVQEPTKVKLPETKIKNAMPVSKRAKNNK
jgi:hypothetical protein